MAKRLKARLICSAVEERPPTPTFKPGPPARRSAKIGIRSLPWPARWARSQSGWTVKT